ncbi:nibrin isoform X2 [Antennarius striatus]|uniref:nibrin isoform X2 n=1 Tax=Antennarius striatus TaxID=241820 RepID=UPI0035B4584D
MWILTPLKQGGETHYLLSSNVYVVGRKNCDILLPNDQSISRAHAHLTATDQTLTLKDCSKYGTFVNSQRLTENTPVNLTCGDNLTFGVFDSKFSVDHQKLVVCSSCLDNDGKASLSQALLALGGKLVNTWSQECTHLTMSSTKVTIKTISALLCCRPIVKPEFFSELSKSAHQKLPPPKVNSFIPEIDEPSLNKEDVNLDIIPHRKQIFTGKTFIFLIAKQLKRLSAAVSFGGGRSQLLEEGSVPEELLGSPQSCVIDVTSGSSQALLPSSTVEWAKSVKNIVQRKGLRIITESEIGLAAIYASCDHYCNPSSLIPHSELGPKMNSRIPSASLSQSVAVDETVLPAPSENITAYAVNTEPTQWTAPSEGTGVVAVGETPEKKQNPKSRQLYECKPEAQNKATGDVTAVLGTHTSGIKSQPSLPTTIGGTKTFLQKQSPKKQKILSQVSPQKQLALTNFFQSVNKKRPLEDDPFTAVSEPKRSLLESSPAVQAAAITVTTKETDRVPAGASQTPLESADLFVGKSEGNPNRFQEKTQNKKRKNMEVDIQMDELESIMSQDMDYFNEPISGSQGHQAQPIICSSTSKEQGLNTVQASSTSKRQRVHLEENGCTRMPQWGSEKESGSLKNHKTSEQCHVSIKTEQIQPCHDSSQPHEVPSTSTNKNRKVFEDDGSFAEDLGLLKVDICHPKEEPKTPLKPVQVEHNKQSKISDDLPEKLVLVEFRSLLVTAPTKEKQKKQGTGNTKNFKCFRKIYTPGENGSAHLIGGSDLLVHNKGKNSDVDEWLKDAAEEECKNRQDESVGDDLFRYNPTKLHKRR